MEQNDDVTSCLIDLGLYIHIPFCIKKCAYCDFLSAPADEETKKKYIEALLIQIRSYQGKTGGYYVPSVFFGGGTPSCIEPEYIAQIMKLLREVFLIDQEQLEATIEVNPGTVSYEKLKAYKEAGLNRLSFGLQSADNNELKLLGRIHSYEQFEDNYHAAREAGFRNINIDLMSALPGQTLESWERTLKQITKLNPEHISAYSLIIEEGTPFFNRYGEGSEGEKMLPEEDTDRLIYHRTKEILKVSGYDRYEISNYAKKGFECRHNSSYWTGTEYLGLGLGASSLIHYKNPQSNSPFNYKRFHIENNLEQYIHLCMEYHKKQQRMNENNKELEEDSIGLQRDIELLTKKQRMEEFMFLGLRLCKGISTTDFTQRFHKNITDIYGDVIMKFVKNNLLKQEGDRLELTEYGIDVSNAVLADFLLSDEPE